MRSARHLLRSSRLPAVAARACGLLLALAFVFVGLQSPLRGLVPRSTAPGSTGNSGSAGSEEEDPSETGAPEKVSDLRVEAMLGSPEDPRSLPSTLVRLEATPRALPAPRLAVRCRRPAVLRLLV